MNKELWPELKEKMAQKIKSKSRSEWIEIFSESDGCVTPVLSMEEAKEDPHKLQKEKLLLNIDGFNQPNASPRYSQTKLKLSITPKELVRPR